MISRCFAFVKTVDGGHQHRRPPRPKHSPGYATIVPTPSRAGYSRHPTASSTAGTTPAPAHRSRSRLCFARLPLPEVRPRCIVVARVSR